MIFQHSKKLSVKSYQLSANQQGVTLLLSILVLAAILAISFSLASVAFVEIRSSGDLVRTEPTYYSADAISEQALFKVKRNATDTQLTYDSNLNKVNLTSSESFTNTAIFQTTVSKTYNSFTATKSHFPIFDANCPTPVANSSTSHCITGGSGYSRVRITYLDTGNNYDTLNVYVCQFDPQKSIDSTGQDPVSYATLPCSVPPSPSSSPYDNYWLQVSTINNTQIPGANQVTVNLDPNKQQELIFYNSPGNADIHALIESFDESLQPKGLPLVGSKAVDVQASSAGVVRKIRTIIPITSSSGATSTSTPVNVAAATQGATALASSEYNSGFPASATIDGERKSPGWGAGTGGWNDATAGVFPDWLEVDFSGTKTINEIDVFTLQDIYWASSDPTPTMTFSNYGITNFDVQYYNGSTWVTVSGGSITGNNLVWRKVTFPSVSTNKIRVQVNGSIDSAWSRITEIEAYTP